MPKRRKKEDSSDDSDSSSSDDTQSPPPKRARGKESAKKEKPKKKPVPLMVTEQMSDKHKRSGAGIVNLLARVDPSTLDGFDPDASKVPNRRWYFEVYHGGKKNKNEVVNRVEIAPKAWFVVGREYDNDIIVMEKKEKISISRRHCVICFTPEGRPALYDLNSTHGTYVNDMSSKLKNDGRIPGGELWPIHPGNRILFGRCGYQYSLVYDGWKDDEEKRKKEELRQRAENARRGGRGRGRGGTYRTLAEINREASKMKQMAENQKKNFGVMMSADLSAIPTIKS